MTDKATMLIRFIRQYFRKHNKFPELKDMSENTKIPRDKLISVLRELETAGKIKRNYSQYKVDADQIKTVQEKVKEKIRDIKLPENTNINGLLVFKIITVIIGIIAAYMSVYFTLQWFAVMLNAFHAVLLSIAIVGFSIISFEAVVIFNRLKKYFVSVIFSILWVIVVVFSMSSTIAGQYNKYMKQDIQQTESNTGNRNVRLLYDNYNNRIADLKIDIESKLKERSKLLEMLEKTEDVQSRDYKDINYRIYLKDSQIKKIRNDINDIQRKIDKILQNNNNVSNSEKPDFFEWLSDIFGISSTLIQFWLNLFPAVFIDIVAPLSFVVILLLNEKKR